MAHESLFDALTVEYQFAAGGVLVQLNEDVGVGPPFTPNLADFVMTYDAAPTMITSVLLNVDPSQLVVTSVDAPLSAAVHLIYTRTTSIIQNSALMDLNNFDLSG